jgi:phosphoribosylaminoimidazole carboxylase (NCAIR synthetase)
MMLRFPVVGIVGAGSLTRMMIAPSISLGVDLLIYATRSEDSAAQVTNQVIGDLEDLGTLQEFAQNCTVLTFGASIPRTMIQAIEMAGVVVRPGSAAMALAKKSNDMINHRHIQGDREVAVTVARSPHGQVSTWTPTLIVRQEDRILSTQTPVTGISERLLLAAQKLALTMTAEVGLVGVMTVQICIRGDELILRELIFGPHESGNWTIEGSRTSQYEQHLRAILDLPLGDPSMTTPYVVTGNIFGGVKRDMYRPYLHLMARSPALKIHQYRQEIGMGHTVGHVTALGQDLLDLSESVAHAVDYMNGVIDE